MNKYLRSLGALFALLFVQASFAGNAMLPKSTSVPVDSPWVISGLVLALAVIGARLLRNRRK